MLRVLSDCASFVAASWLQSATAKPRRRYNFQYTRKTYSIIFLNKKKKHRTLKNMRIQVKFKVQLGYGEKIRKNTVISSHDKTTGREMRGSGQDRQRCGRIQ